MYIYTLSRVSHSLILIVLFALFFFQSYKEYGVNDYRATLRQLGGRLAPATNNVTFLHCPIPDFSVLETQSLMSLVAELQRVLSEGRVRDLFIFFYFFSSFIHNNLLLPVL